MSAIVAKVVQQHADDCAHLHGVRTLLSGAGHVKLHHLRRLDDRIDAHLDGLTIAGREALPMLRANLATPSSGSAFAAAVRAIEDRDEKFLDQLFALAGAVPQAFDGIKAAFGWLERTQLQRIVVGLLESTEPLRRLTGIAACAMHRVDPGIVVAHRMDDPVPLVRARVWRTIGELGQRQFVSTCAAAIDDDDETCRFWAAWSAVLSGDRRRALDYLRLLASENGSFRERAFWLAILALPVEGVQELLAQLARQSVHKRWLIWGAALSGDPKYVPWLIEQMADELCARLAGEAFSFITGADLAWLDLDRKPPAQVPDAPNENPNDANVTLSREEGLPWPDRDLVQRWWLQSREHFIPGRRYLCGQPLSREACLEVLKKGFQRQRITAALELCLLDPGKPLFEWRAPARRQQWQLLH